MTVLLFVDVPLPGAVTGKQALPPESSGPQTSPAKHPAVPGVQERTQTGLAESMETQANHPRQSEPLHGCPSVFRGWFSNEQDKVTSRLAKRVKH